MSEASRLKFVAEIAGAIGVVLSLVFVGLELRHANNLSQAEAVNSINQMINDQNLLLAQDAALAALIARLNDVEPEYIDTLTPGEGLQVFHFYATHMNTYETAWKYMERGIVTRDEGGTYLAVACTEFTGNDATIVLWGRLRGAFALGYVADVEAQCPALHTAAKE